MFNTHGTPGSDFRAHQAMGQGVEFDTIRLLLERWGDLAVDIGDDAAVLPLISSGHRVVSTDACVEDVHFRRAWLSPYEVGQRAAAAALSDLAAMGAHAECVLVALVVPPSWHAELPQVADGIGAQVRAAGARIVGGNLSRGGTFAITLTVIGVADRVVSRAGAQVGDLVLVTGTLGGPGAALAAWERGDQPGDWARARFSAPSPRLGAGRALAAAGATAMLDISDGLAADARHLGAASAVSLSLDPARLPVGPAVEPASALQSGEEYELLVTMPPASFAALAGRWEAEQGIPLTVIGAVVPASSMPASSSVAGGSAGHDVLPGHDHFGHDRD